MRMFCYLAVIICTARTCVSAASADEVAVEDHLQLQDIFQLEYASDPRISAEGKTVVYVRNFMDIMKDVRRSNLWSIGFDGLNHRPLTTGLENHSSPRFSPDGGRLLYVSSADGSSQLYVRWMDTGHTAKLTQLPRSPRGLSWSPDGKWIAFAMSVPAHRKPFVNMPPAPKGSQWAEPAKVIQHMFYRSDGAGYLEDGHKHIFVLPADGGTPRQLTTGAFNHNGAPTWTPDSKALVFSANRHADWEFDPLNSEIHEVALAGGANRTLTDRRGPDRNPVISPTGRHIAYVGFDDHEQGYETTKLYVMNRDGSESRLLTADLDRSVQRPVWDHAGDGIYFQFSDQGETKLAHASLAGVVRTITGHIGGTSLGRPYGGGSFTVADNGRYALTHSTPDHPADIAVGGPQTEAHRITTLNEDLFSFRKLGSVEEIRYPSSFDHREIQGWIVKPPNFDASSRYPLILEIHGGPFADYGSRFSAEAQLYAAAGYVVLYTNPRGSTSYGQAFGNLIHHNYPGEDYDDLMSGVDAVIAKGYIDPQRLFVTGGSGGGVLTSWIVGKTERFAAAVVAKPVINWISFVLTADRYTFFHKYWFADYPWNIPDEYMRRSPLSLVGNVVTPTMLLTGEADYRTPISESEQYFQALKLRKVDTVMVRVPGASHGIGARPSHLMAKVAHILKWFDDHGGKSATTARAQGPAAHTASGVNWPSFRGSFAGGVAEGHALPTEWDVKSGQNVKWRVPIAGLGHASPVIWGSRVFVTSAVNSQGEAFLRVGLYGESPDHSEDVEHHYKVLCLDKHSGEMLWEQTAFKGIPKVKRHVKASHANCTPVTDGTHLVAFFGSQGLYCYDLHGTLLWKKDLGRFDAGPANAAGLQWGFASSPVIHDGKVYVVCAARNVAFVAAYYLENGAQAWRTERPRYPGWHTPGVYTGPGRAQLVTNGFEHIGGYDLATGRELWKLRGGGDVPVPTPIFGHGMFYIANAHGGRSPIYAIRDTASGDITPDSGETSNEHIAFTVSGVRNYMQTPLLYGDYLYGCRNNGVMSCTDARTGEHHFKERLDSGVGFTASPVAGDGKVYFTSEEGDVHVIRVGRQFERLARNSMNAICMATPAISEGRLYYRTTAHLIAIGR